MIPKKKFLWRIHPGHLPVAANWYAFELGEDGQVLKDIA